MLDMMEQALEEEERNFSEEENFVTSFATGETKDVVQLDVSGEVMAVRRSTLRLCEGSVLYHQFDDTSWRQGNTIRGSASKTQIPIVMLMAC